jgi:hypothetical protein
MRSLVAFVGCVVTAACASTQSRPSETPSRQLGSYSVVARADGVALRGRANIRTDVVEFELERTECRPDSRDLSIMGVNYECNPVNNLTDIRVFIAWEDPTHSSYWRAKTVRTTYVRTCMNFTIVNGREVCSSYQNVPTEQIASVVGELVLTRQASR